MQECSKLQEFCPVTNKGMVADLCWIPSINWRTPPLGPLVPHGLHLYFAYNFFNSQMHCHVSICYWSCSQKQLLTNS